MLHLDYFKKCFDYTEIQKVKEREHKTLVGENKNQAKKMEN